MAKQVITGQCGYGEGTGGTCQLEELTAGEFWSWSVHRHFVESLSALADAAICYTTVSIAVACRATHAGEGTVAALFSRMI
jgi:hypothetical protein